MRTLLVPSILLVASACASGHPANATGSVDAQLAADLARLRDATRPYQVLDSAVAAGYPRELPDCLIHEHHGAMGYHHVNRAYLDAIVDVTKPEILLYERLDDGRYRLNGVEFIVPFRFWPSDSTPPRLMGRPMKRETNLNIWYTHVWAWTANPDGVFADFHPDVKCPDGTGKIYRPSGPDGG